MKKKTQKCDRLHYTLLGLCILFGGVAIGSLCTDLLVSGGFDTSKKIVRANGQTYVSVRSLSEEFKVELDKKSEFAVYKDKTWIPVPGHPVEMIVLNDKNCGNKCDTAREVSSLRQAVTPALLVRNVDISESEGQELIEKFEINSVPKFFLGDGLDSIKDAEGKKFVETSSNILIENGDLYLIDSGKVGFKAGKYIEAPKFADTDTEPKKGNGKVRVVEFTDYQCPYCKRLHDNNKELIGRLIAEGKIEYIMKDFPLGFHKEATDAHLAANCAQKLGGNEAHWIMHDKIFDGQKDWSGKGERAKSYFKTLAEELVLDADEFDACMSDPEMVAEIEADKEEGSKFGVSGTPALFIGKQVMPGAIGAESFEAAVEDELK